MELIASPCSWTWVKVLTSITWCHVCCRDMFHKDLSTGTQSTAMLSTVQEMMYFTKANLKRSYFRFASPPTTESPGQGLFKQLPTPGPKCWNCPSLRSCPLPIIPLSLSREEGMIHFFVGSHVKKPESGLFFWLDRKQYGWFALFQLAKMSPSVSYCWVCIFACFMSGEYTRDFVIKFLSAQSSWIWRMPK